MKLKNMKLADFKVRSFIMELGNHPAAIIGALGQDTYDGHNCYGSCPIDTICSYSTTWPSTD